MSLYSNNYTHVQLTSPSHSHYSSFIVVGLGCACVMVVGTGNQIQNELCDNFHFIVCTVHA